MEGGCIKLKFEELDFPGKDRVKFSAVNEIMHVLDHTLTMDCFSHLAVLRYLEVLVDGQDYNVKTKVFYDNVTNKKLSFDFLASVAHEYILEHAEEFKN